jgi:hypothetical protein
MEEKKYKVLIKRISHIEFEGKKKWALAGSGEKKVALPCYSYEVLVLGEGLSFQDAKILRSKNKESYIVMEKA